MTTARSTGTLIGVPRVYYDNTFYDSIAKKRAGFSPEDVEEFRALSGHVIRSYFSPVNGDEILAQWASDAAGALQRLVIARDLVGFGNVLKQPSDLLRDEIIAYAQGLASPPKTMSPRMAEFFDRGLRAVANGGPNAAHLAAKVAADVTRLKDADKKPIADARDEVLTAMRWGERAAEERIVPFEKYLADFGPALVEAYADSLGVGEACRRRGIAGLLKRRAVEFLVGAQASWIYGMTVPSAGGLDTRQVHRNDGYDNWHTLEASAADIFVTGDARLATRLKSLNIADFAVVASLRELLDFVRVAEWCAASCAPSRSARAVRESAAATRASRATSPPAVGRAAVRRRRT